MWTSKNPPEIGVVIADVVRPRVTLTPSRVTVKWNGETLDYSRDKLIQFILDVATRLQPIEHGWRGRIYHTNEYLYTYMVNPSRSKRIAFRSDGKMVQTHGAWTRTAAA